MFLSIQSYLSTTFADLAEIKPYIWVTLSIIVLACMILFVLSKKNIAPSQSYNTKKVVYGGLCVALAFVLSYIKIWHMPQGGSITLASMLPLVLYAFAFGPISGIIAGVAYGFLQIFQEMYVFHWIQVALDYPLAFGVLGLAGIIPSKIKSLHLRFSFGIMLGIFCRYIMHVISGAVFFAEYAGDQNPWIYSVIYNATYLSVELVITIVLGLLLASTPIYKTLKASASNSL